MIKSIIALTLFSVSSWAEIPENVKHEIDQRTAHQLNPSIVVAVYDQGQSDFYVKGLQNKELKTLATTKTVYEIGSISKTYTSLLLAQMVVEEKLQLNDPVESIWPEPFSLKDSNNQAITLKQLATHTSGLPRLPDNLNAFSKDPYADYDRIKLLKAVQQLEIKKAGVSYFYSNFAVGLLGETLAQHKNTSYNALIEKNILQPLNLKQTHMTLETVPEQVKAQGYHNNWPTSDWQFQALAGAGSIRSSIEDLLAYGVANLNQPEKTLKEAMRLATRIHHKQGPFDVGLGWHFNADGMLWHNGGTAGFSSIIMIDPNTQKVVAGITNSSPSANIEDIVLHLMDPTKPMTDHEFPVDIEAAKLTQFTGDFKLMAGDKKIKIIAANDQLYFSAPKQPRQALVYIGNDTFKVKLFNAKLHFKRNENGNITELDFTGWGEPQTYQKVE